MTKRIPFFVLFAILLAGCNLVAPKKSLKAGTKIPLSLAQTLVSGEAKEGDSVRLVVAEDVQIEGKTVISAGSPAVGKVAWSRGEGVLSGLTNQPARLTIQLVSVTASDGTQVSIQAEDPKEGFAFTRGNTGRTEFIQNLEKVLGRDESKSALEALQKRVETGEKVDLDGPEMKSTLESLSKELSLEKLGDAATDGKVGELADMAHSVKQGVALANGDVSLAGALQALSLVEAVGSRLDRMLRGRTIRAFPGTPVTAQVATEAQVVAR